HPSASALVHSSDARLRRWFTAPASASALVNGSDVGFGVGSWHRRCFTAAASALFHVSGIGSGVGFSDNTGHFIFLLVFCWTSLVNPNYPRHQ
ncbi:hypothetical protein BVRB_026260, partial [Beta vulgaris subsp. vulgaris]